MSPFVFVIATLTGPDAIHQLVREDGGRSVMRTFVRDFDMDRELTDAEAMDWCETVLRCGGEVRRGVVKWPVRT
jgi:hypothetical protein